MRNIETRLSKLERVAAESEVVEVWYKDQTRAEMDLLRAVRLLIAGRVRQITAPWKPGEMEQHLKGTALEIEKWFDAKREELEIT